MQIRLNKSIYWGLTSAILIHFFLAVLVWRFYTVDDAFITFRYSRYFADGNGPVFNLDGTRVEGYTSPLWMAALAISYFINPDLETSSKILGLTFNLGTLLVTALYLRKYLIDKQPIWTLAAPLIWLAVHPLLVFSSIEGLETPAFTFLMIVTLYAVSNPNPSHSTSIVVIAGLAGLYFTRPDGILVIFVVGLLWLLGILPVTPAGASERFKKGFAVFVPLGLIILLHIGWRYQYYGYFFPTTFYAKSGGSLSHFLVGGTRLANFLNDSGVIFVLLLQPFLIWELRRKKRQLKIYILLLTLILSRFVFQLYSGGEIMGVHRFLTPTIPLWSVLWIWSSWYAAKAIRHRWRMISFSSEKIFAFITFILLAFTTVKFLFIGISLHGQRANLTNNHEALGQWLQENAKDDWLVAAGDVGISFYVAQHVRVLDLMGLNDYHIAQLPGKWIPREKSPKSDVSYVLKANPEIIVLRGDLTSFQTIERDLWFEKAFQENYMFIHQQGWLSVYVRADLERVQWDEK